MWCLFFPLLSEKGGLSGLFLLTIKQDLLLIMLLTAEASHDVGADVIKKERLLSHLRMQESFGISAKHLLGPFGACEAQALKMSLNISPPSLPVCTQQTALCIHQNALYHGETI